MATASTRNTGAAPTSKLAAPSSSGWLHVPTATGPISHLTAADAAALDEELMKAEGPYRYTLEQLMELAGLAVAQSVYDFIGRKAATATRILVVCGPGNNGGDGMVAARHLAEFFNDAGQETSSMMIEMIIPKKSEKNPYFAKLVQQALASGVKEISDMPSASDLKRDRAIIVDAILGFGSKGAPRSPFTEIIEIINDASDGDGDTSSGTGAMVCCVDIPSGWDVDKGFDRDIVSIRKPAMLVSLTLPKIGVKGHFSSSERDVAHYVGGRFVPRELARRFDMPQYSGFHQVVRLIGASEPTAAEERQG